MVVLEYTPCVDTLFTEYSASRVLFFDFITYTIASHIKFNFYVVEVDYAYIIITTFGIDPIPFQFIEFFVNHKKLCGTITIMCSHDGYLMSY